VAGFAAACGGLIAAALAAATPPAREPPPESPPSAELLLYLAEFGDADDRFVDPTTIAGDDEDPAAADAGASKNPEDADDAPPDRPR
jgi:hypothetical protein